MAKISGLPILAAPVGDELVPVLDTAGTTRAARLRPLFEAASANALARADASAASAAASLADVISNVGAVLELGMLAPNAWPDPDNTGLAGWATNGNALKRPSVGTFNGRPTIIATGQTVYFRVNLDDAGCPVDQDFTFAFTALAMTIAAGSAGATILAQALDTNQQVISGTPYTFVSGTAVPALPRRYGRTWRRTATMRFLEGYFFFGDKATNAVTATDFLIAPGTSQNFRPSLIGRGVSLDDYLALQDASDEQWDRPNIWPDPKITGLATGNWSGGDVPVVRRANGRRFYRLSDGLRRIRMSVAGVGAAGSTFSASATMRLVGGTQAAAVTISQTRADGTTINGTARSFALTSEAWSRERLRPLASMVVHAEASTIDVTLDARGGGLIELSLPSVHGGDNPARRAPLPSPDQLRRYIGTTNTDPSGVTAHYFVDGRPGATAASDTNDGTTAETPFRSLAAAIAAVGTAADRIIAVRRGSIFRNDTIETAAPGLTTILYGEGPAPKSLGSVAFSRARLTDAGTGVFTLALPYKPSTCALVEVATGKVVKLLNPDSNDVPPATGNWGWANNLLYIKPGFDPVGYVLEVPRGDGKGYGYHAAAPRQTITGIEFEHWRDHGASSNQADTRWLGVWCNWNGFDGFDQDAGAERFLIRGGGALGNGRRYGSDLGPGDGSSGHMRANGIIEGATFKWNTQTGVGNLRDTAIEVRYCYFEDNQVDLQVYGHAGGDYDSPVQPGAWWHHNVHVHKVRGSAFAINAKIPTLTTRIHHLTIYSTFAQFCLGTISGTLVDLANIVLVAPGTTFAFANYCEADGSIGKVTSRNNVAFGVSAAWQSGGYDATRGGGSETGLLTSDPLLADPSGGDLSLLAGSPAIGSAVALGYTRDYAGARIGSALDRGALRAA